MVPVIVSMITALYSSRSYFSIILLEGGVGKNGSTVAVSIVTAFVGFTQYYSIEATCFLDSSKCGCCLKIERLGQKKIWC